ncbi:MAG: hypothetical protein H0V10_16650 [Geodermatophilaceae bacterium]|nr:hypothetical protein [Geodermatophilaceae bacterium]
MRRCTLRTAAMVCLFGSAAACGGTTPAATTSSTPPSDSTESLAIGGREAVSVHIAGSPDWLAADEDNVYVKRDNGGVDVLDPTTAAVVRSFDLGNDLCQGLGVADGTLWSCSGPELVRIDLGSGAVAPTAAVGKTFEQGELNVGFGRLWVLLGDGSSLLGIDVDTDQPGEPIALPVRGTDVALGPDRVWVLSAVDNAAVEVDPDAGVVRRIDGLAGARAAVAVPDALWVGGIAETYRIELSTGAVTATVDGGIGRVGAIAADDEGVWVREGGVTLTHLDAVSGAVLEEMSADIGSGGDLVVAFDALWLTAFDHETLLRIPLDKS